MADITAGAGGAIGAIVFMLALTIYSVVRTALNTTSLDAGTLSLVALIPLVLTGGFIISVVVAALGFFM